MGAAAAPGAAEPLGCCRAECAEGCRRRCGPRCAKACCRLSQMELRRQAAVDQQRIRAEMILARNAGAVDPSLEAGKTVGREEEALGRRFRAMGTALLGAAGPRLDSSALKGLTGRSDHEHEDDTADSFYELVKRGRRQPGQRLPVIEPDAQLREGAAAGNLDCTIQAIEANAEVDAASARGVTPLMFACASAPTASNDPLLVIHELLDRKADVNLVDNWGWNCLHYACRSGRTEAMRCLIQRKADPLALTEDQQTVLMLAVIEGKLEIVREMLREKVVHSIMSHADKTGATALHYSVRLKDNKMMRLLIDYKAKVHMRDQMGRTVMSWACEYGSLEFVKVLHKKHVDIKSVDAEGRTALLYAIRHGDEGSSLFLLEHGADQDRKDVYGQTPKELAKEVGLNEVTHSMKVIAGVAI